MYPPNHVGKPIHEIQDPWDESAVLHKKDKGYPGITCTIYYQKIKNALCDLGASVNLMPKAMFEELGYLAISPTTMTVQLADSLVKYPKDILRTRGACRSRHGCYKDASNPRETFLEHRQC
jgi:hypothetical protein